MSGIIIEKLSFINELYLILMFLEGALVILTNGAFDLAVNYSILI